MTIVIYVHGLVGICMQSFEYVFESNQNIKKKVTGLRRDINERANALSFVQRLTAWLIDGYGIVVKKKNCV